MDKKKPFDSKKGAFGKKEPMAAKKPGKPAPDVQRKEATKPGQVMAQKKGSEPERHVKVARDIPYKKTDTTPGAVGARPATSPTIQPVQPAQTPQPAQPVQPAQVGDTAKKSGCLTGLIGWLFRM